jgi:hypothetical protein
MRKQREVDGFECFLVDEQRGLCADVSNTGVKLLNQLGFKLLDVV